MKQIFYILLFLTLINCHSDVDIEKPPLAEVHNVVDNYFGKEISDPYRYMENLQDTVVQNWLKLQDDYARKVLKSIPGRQYLIDKMMEFDKRATSQALWPVITINDRYFYLKISPTDETYKLYFREKVGSEEVLLFDPISFRTNSTDTYEIATFFPSHDGSKMAISLMKNGLDIPVRIVLDVDNRKLFPEVLERSYNFTWLADGSGFLHQPLNTGDPNSQETYLNTKVYHHILNTDPSTDREIFSLEKYPDLGIKPEHFNYPIFYEGCDYIFIMAASQHNNNLFYAPISELGKEIINWKHLFKPEDKVRSFRVTSDELYIRTSRNAPNYKIIKTSIKKPDLINAKVVVAENPIANISSFTLTSEGLYYNLSYNGVQQKTYFLSYRDNKLLELPLPISAGSITINSKGYRYSDLWLSISGWTSNLRRYRYLSAENLFILEMLSEETKYPEYEDFLVEEIMVESHDGVKVPLSLVYKKGMKMNGENPVLLTGYGAYGRSLKPEFDPDLLLFAYEGGIIATAHVRGGGELGEQWRNGGLKTTKANSWKDLIACTKYLISENYSSSKNIAIHGMSAGGITIGRAMAERPELFAVAIPKVGWMNTLRFEESPFGQQNVGEIGTVKDSVECMALIEMDAYLNLKEGINYPATLVTAGMNDTKAIAWGPAKFAARLKAVNVSDNPILFRVDYETGHVSDTKTKYYNDIADVLSFVLWQTGHPKYQLK